MRRKTYKTAGWSELDELTVDCNICRCGPIRDGISMEHDKSGGFVLSFRDLEDIYKKAKKVRAK